MGSRIKILASSLTIVLCFASSAMAERVFKDSPEVTGKPLIVYQLPAHLQEYKSAPGALAGSGQLQLIIDRISLLEEKIDLLNKRIDQIEKGEK